MAMQRDILAFIIIVILSLISCSSSIHEDLQDHNCSQEESGYNFQAYPSYISTMNSNHFEYNSTMLETKAHDALSRFSRLENPVVTINVDSFGAKGDGNDDTKAFQVAWKAACVSTVPVNLVVSQGKNYLLKPITFSGPCKSDIMMQIYGTLTASDDRSDYSKDGRHWLLFDSVQNLTVEGGGIINGNGYIWWQNSCKINKALPCKIAPTAVTFYKCQNLIVQNIKVQDAQQIHMSFEICVNVQASNLAVTAPEKSPNTDGIHVTNTQNIQIYSCTIGTGDDCISFASGTQMVQATDITCGPGHGISIGSLGGGNSEAYVSDVTVNRAKLSGTANGVRIKTWPGGSGSASNIKFQNIQMQDVKNPIIVDQNYCEQSTSCNQQHSAVQVTNVVYQNIKGTSASDLAINFNCSKIFPCQGIVLENIDLEGEGGRAAKAICNNVNLSYVESVSPSCPQQDA